MHELRTIHAQIDDCAQGRWRIIIAGVAKSAPGSTFWAELASQFAPLDEVVRVNDLAEGTSS